MGNYNNKNSSILATNTDIISIQTQMKLKYDIPIEVQVAHYTPSIFPLVPIINPTINKLCVDSWKYIVQKREMTASGIELTGITLFYNDFYERLNIVDENKKIESVLSSHSYGLNKIAEKGAIIIRIVNYALSLTTNDEQTQFRLYTLGKAHAKRAIRPYMYSIFVQTLLYTISNQLENHANHEVMEAWVNLFSFIMKSMLPLAIRDQTIETEIAINTKTVFSSDDMKEQVLEAKDHFADNKSEQGSKQHSIRSLPRVNIKESEHSFRSVKTAGIVTPRPKVGKLYMIDSVDNETDV